MTTSMRFPLSMEELAPSSEQPCPYEAGAGSGCLPGGAGRLPSSQHSMTELQWQLHVRAGVASSLRALRPRVRKGGQQLGRLNPPGGQLGDQPAVGGKEVIVAQLAGKHPGNPLESARLKLRLSDSRSEKGDGKQFAVRIAELGLSYEHVAEQRDAEFLPEFARQRLSLRFAGLN